MSLWALMRGAGWHRRYAEELRMRRGEAEEDEEEQEAMQAQAGRQRRCGFPSLLYAWIMLQEMHEKMWPSTPTQSALP